MKWVLLVNETDSPFWLSDDPVTYYNGLPHDPLDGQGFDRMVFLTFDSPLSPTLLLSILDPRSFPHYPERVPVDKTENVTFYNSLQVKNSERFVLSSDAAFTLAQKMIARNPGLRDPSQNRFSHLK